MKTYTIETYRPLPSIGTTKVSVTADGYQAAVQLAANSWRETGRTTCLHSGPHAIYYYHMIDASGAFTDRNKNSGVPANGFWGK